MKRVLLLVCGWALVAIAAVGVILPVLPTTPFVLLAALCFSCSSEKMYRLLLKSRLFGPYIENYRTKQGVSAAVKARAIVLLWLLLGVSAAAMHRTWSTVLFSAVGIGVTAHLLALKTKKAPGAKLSAAPGPPEGRAGEKPL